MCLFLVEGKGSQNITHALHWSSGKEHQTNQTVLPAVQSTLAGLVQCHCPVHSNPFAFFSFIQKLQHDKRRESLQHN